MGTAHDASTAILGVAAVLAGSVILSAAAFSFVERPAARVLRGWMGPSAPSPTR